MSTSKTIIALRSAINEQHLPLLLRALHRLPAIWDLVQEPKLIETALDRFGNQLESWTPANLSLLKLEANIPLEELRNFNQPLPAEINLSAQQVYEKFRNKEIIDFEGISEAGLLALAMRDRYRLLGSWENIIQEIKAVNNREIKIVLACLYTLIDKPDNFFKLLCQNDGYLTACIDAIYAQPLPSNSQAHLAAKFVVQAPTPERLTLLTSLEHHYPEDARNIAKELVHIGSRTEHLDANVGSTPTPFRWLADLPNLLYDATLHRLAEKNTQALQAYQAINAQMRNFSIDINRWLLTEAQAASRFEIIDAFLTDSLNTNQISPELIGVINLETQADGQIEAIRSVLSGQNSAPEMLFFDAVLEHQSGQDGEARALLGKAIEGWHSFAHTPDAEQITQAIHLSLELGQPDDALGLARMLNQTQPQDSKSLILLSRALRETGNANEAVEYAYLAAGFDPNELEIRRELARCLEAAGDWDAALPERQFILQHSNQQKTAKTKVGNGINRIDARALAISTQNTGRTEEALSICWSLLESDSEDGLTHKTLGDIYEKTGEHELALEHYQRANQLVPDDPCTWLALANIHQQSGNLEKAVETLQTAAQALPDDSHIQLALGKLYRVQDHPTQAMGVLKKAADLEHLPYQLEKHDILEPAQSKSTRQYLNPHSSEICLVLGSVLLELGHAAEAQAILTHVYKTQEYKIASAYLFARSLIAQGKEQEALSALSIAYQNNPADSALALEYSRMLCKFGDEPEQAVRVLENLLENNPNLPEAIGLIAEALAALGRCEEAMAYYKRAMDTPLMGDPRWSIRLALGLSHVAVDLGKPDIAIAALQDAITSSPGHLVLHQKLSEACLAAGLPEDASEAAHRAFEIAPADLENLEWYAFQMIELGDPAQALIALENAADLSTNDPEIYLQQAHILQKLSKLEAATEKFEKAIQMPEVTLEQLYTAASGLMDLGNPHTAIQHLERVRQDTLPQAAPLSQNILTTLARGYLDANQVDRSLEVLEEALQRNPGSIPLLQQKAKVHFLLGQSAASLACLSQVLNQQPDDPDVHLLAAEVYKHDVNLVMALDCARKYQKFAPVEQAMSANIYTARLSWRLFLQEETKNLLELPGLSSTYADDPQNSLEANLILALIAIDQGDIPTIANIEEKLHSAGRASAGCRALEAYLYAVKNEESKALEKYCQAFDTAAAASPLASYEYEILIETAIYLHEFTDARKWVQQWQQSDPNDPRAYRMEIRILVERAETQRFLESVKAINRAKQLNGLSQEANSRFESSVQQTIKLLSLPAPSSSEDYVLPLASNDPVYRWHARGRAAFSTLEGMPPDSQTKLLQILAKLEPEPNNTTAYISALLRAGKKEQAAIAGREYPNHPPAQAHLALSLLDAKPAEAMAAALSAIETIVALREQRMLPAYQSIIAQVAGLAGEPGQAYQAIKSALGDWPDEPDWHCLAAKFADQTGNVTNELSHLEKAVSLAQDNPTYQVELAEAYFRTGAFVRAVNAYENVCALEPNHWQHWVRLAEIQAERGETYHASQAIEEALKLEPEQVDIQLFAAELALQEKNWSRAQALSKHVLDTQPDNAAASYLLSRALTGLNRREEALKILDHALKYADRPVQLYLERIRLVRSLQGLQPAYQSLLALNQQNPGHPAVLALLAEYLQEQGRTTDALEAAHAALQNSGEQLSKAEIARLHILIGRTLRRTGQLDQAIHQFTEALQLIPYQIELFLELGKAYQERRQVQEALEVYQKAIQHYPEDPRPYQQAGLALKESKDYLGAEKMIRRAAELSPHDISIHRMLGSLVALNLVHSAQ